MIVNCAHREGFPLYPVSARAFVTKCNDKVYSDGKLKSPYVHARHGYDESQMVFRSSFPVFTVLQFHNVPLPPNLPSCASRSTPTVLATAHDAPRRRPLAPFP